LEGQSCLLSGGAPDSPVCHRTANVHVRCPIPFQIGHSRPLQIGGSWRTRHCPVHTGQSGAPCRQLERATRRPQIWRPTVALAAVGSPDSPVCHRTANVHVRCPIPFQIGHSRPLQIGGSWRTRHCLVHTGQSGAPCRQLERATRRPRIWRPTVVLAAVGSPDSPVHHRTVR
jgi:hypothetical protein